MSTSKLRPRLAAACGLLYPVLLVVGDDVIAGGDALADAGSPEQTLAVLAEKDTMTFFLGRSLGLVALMCLFVFAAYIAAQLRRYRGPGDLLAYLVLGSGAMAATLQMSSAAFQIPLVRDGAAGLDGAMVQTLLNMGWEFMFAWLPLAVMLGAVAVEGSRGTIVARGVGWTAGIIAIGFAAGFILGMIEVGEATGYFAMMLSWVWFVAASISMMRRVGRSPEVPAAHVAAHP